MASLVYESPVFHSLQPTSMWGSRRDGFLVQLRDCRRPSSSRQTHVKGIVRCGLAEKDGGRKVIVIGAGVGGLAVAGKLAYEGFDVQILEKNADAGGRLQSLYAELGGQETFRFDTGPSLLLLPQKYRDAFTAMGTKSSAFRVCLGNMAFHNMAFPANPSFSLSPFPRSPSLNSRTPQTQSLDGEQTCEIFSMSNFPSRGMGF